MLRLAASLPDALVGLRHTAMAHAAWACTSATAAGEALAAAVEWRMESSTASYTSFWRWSKAPLPIRTGWPRRSRRSSRVVSVRSRRPSIRT